MRLKVVHRSGRRADASRTTGGDDRSVNALQQLIQDWLDADPSHTVGLLAHRSGLSRNTIYAIMGRDDPAGLPRRQSLEGIARGISQPVAVVRAAASEAAGYRVTADMDPDSQEVQAWIALLEDLPDQRRKDLWEIGRMYLRRAKDDT